MAALLAILALLAAANPAPQADVGFLAFAETPRRPGNLLVREGEIGRSAAGRPIELRQVGDPRWSGELLVFGCSHGDECGAGRFEPLSGGCPDPGADILLAPDLDPEPRLAARVIRAVRPAATIRLRQYRGRRSLVRAWGHSVPGARHFSRLAQMPFRPMRRPLGTGPSRQNHTQRDSSSFVVQLPQGSSIRGCANA